MKNISRKTKLSIVIPCYNEANTLRECVEKVRCIAEENLSLEIIIVDDNSTDGSSVIAKELSENYQEIQFIQQEKNYGKGAALRKGFSAATGDFIAVQDADLEYDPRDLKRLIVPLIDNRADMVIGSRFQTDGPHRVLYFWHSMGNKFLTFLSNMFTDLNLTDMEAGYKVFKRSVIQKIEIEEDRFGFEPEIIAKVSQMKLRIYEMGVSYFGRTYEEGKKIGYRDGIRAFYCIFKYNAYGAPLPTKIIMYSFVAMITILLNLLVFFKLYLFEFDMNVAIPVAFFSAAVINYPFIFFNLLGKKKRILKSYIEFSVFIFILSIFSYIDFQFTNALITNDFSLATSKILSISIILIINFFIRKYWLIPVKDGSNV